MKCVIEPESRRVRKTLKGVTDPVPAMTIVALGIPRRRYAAGSEVPSAKGFRTYSEAARPSMMPMPN
jgi:hypothetical protein